MTSYVILCLMLFIWPFGKKPVQVDHHPTAQADIAAQSAKPAFVTVCASSPDVAAVQTVSGPLPTNDTSDGGTVGNSNPNLAQVDYRATTGTNCIIGNTSPPK